MADEVALDSRNHQDVTDKYWDEVREMSKIDWSASDVQRFDGTHFRPMYPKAGRLALYGQVDWVACLKDMALRIERLEKLVVKQAEEDAVCNDPLSYDLLPEMNRELQALKKAIIETMDEMLT